MAAQHHDVVIVGGGLAGIVTALEALRAGQSVALVDRDAPERLGGLALWAFGGMALVGTALLVWGGFQVPVDWLLWYGMAALLVLTAAWMLRA